MSELTVPKEWAKINISYIADVDLGKTPKKKDYRSDGLYKVVKFRDVGYEGIDWSKNKDGFVPEDSTKDLRKLEVDDVLITASAHSSEHIGRKICLVNKIPKNYKNVFYCGELLGIRAYKDILNPKFAFLYFLSHSGYKEIQSRVKGVHLTSGQARNMTVPFASYEEQGQIIEIIEQLFSDLDNAIDNLKKAKDQLKVYRQSVLKYAFEGKWKKVELKKISESCGGFAFKSSSFQNRGAYQVIRIGNVRPGAIRLNVSPIFLDNLEKKILDKYLLKLGDVVISLTGTRKKRDYGYTAIIQKKNLLLNQRLAFLRLHKECLPKFFLYYSWTELFKNSFFDSETGNVGQGNVGMKAIQVTKIPLPFLIEQQKIVSEIESRFSVSDKMEETIEDSLNQAEALRQSILKQAFEGKLTEEWRKNNPELVSRENSAKALLEKIKAEHEALKNTKKRKK